MRSQNINIEILSRVRKLPLSLSALEKITTKILLKLGWKKASLSIFFVGDQKIRTLNRKYLRHDWVTDVIAFPQQKKPRPKSQNTFLGDLAIGVPTAKRQSQQFGTSFKYELCFYLCHGILHLMGYDDKTKRGSLWMNRKQKEILKKVGVK